MIQIRRSHRSPARLVRIAFLAAGAATLSLHPTPAQEPRQDGTETHEARVRIERYRAQARKLEAGLERMRRQLHEVEEQDHEEAAERLRRRMHELEQRLERTIDREQRLARALERRDEPDLEPERVLHALGRAAGMLRAAGLAKDAAILTRLLHDIERDVHAEHARRGLMAAARRVSEQLRRARERDDEDEVRELEQKLEALNRRLHGGPGSSLRHADEERLHAELLERAERQARRVEDLERRVEDLVEVVERLSRRVERGPRIR